MKKAKQKKAKTFDEEYGTVTSADLPLPESKPNYPPASCIKCNTDMTEQGTRRWEWNGEKLIGPVCKECIVSKRK